SDSSASSKTGTSEGTYSSQSSNKSNLQPKDDYPITSSLWNPRDTQWDRTRYDLAGGLKEAFDYGGLVNIKDESSKSAKWFQWDRYPSDPKNVWSVPKQVAFVLKADDESGSYAIRP